MRTLKDFRPLVATRIGINIDGKRFNKHASILWMDDSNAYLGYLTIKHDMFHAHIDHLQFKSLIDEVDMLVNTLQLIEIQNTNFRIFEIPKDWMANDR